MTAPTQPALRFGPQDTRPECQMCGKIAFESMERAEHHAARITERSNKTMTAYYKPKCGWFHLTTVRS